MGWAVPGGARPPRLPAPATVAPRSLADHAQQFVAVRLHVLAGSQRLDAQAQKRLGVRRPGIEMPVLVVDRDPVETALAPVRVSLGELLELGLRVLDLAVDLSGDEVARSVGLEQLRHRRLAAGE